MKKPLAFLKKISKNNNREWFNEHKPAYEEAHAEIKSFAQELHEKMMKYDELTKKPKIYRIYRDIRFSKDKTPFKTNFSGGFAREGDHLRGGYYWHIQPGGKSMIGCGFFNPNPADLLHIRKQIQQDPDLLRKVLKSKKFKTHFGELEGDQVKTSPKGFDKEDPAIELLRFKQFIIIENFTDAEVLNPNFSDQLVQSFRAAKPFLDVMTEYLTTDLNGISLVD